MTCESFKTHTLFLLAIALATVIYLIPTGSAMVSAISMHDYFTIDYDVSFSHTTIYDNEPFSATVTGTAVCIQDLPLTISEAVISGCIVAQHEDSGEWVTLNPGFTTTINPFPASAGDTTSDSQTVELSFPADSQFGSYQVFGELIEAKVKAVLWFNVTSYLPQYQSMGSISYLPYEDDMPIEDIDDTDKTEPEIPGTTNLSDYIDQSGAITETVLARSADFICTVTLSEGSTALDIDGNPLEKISIVRMEDTPLPPPYAHTIIAYEITPGGAIFQPPANISILCGSFHLPTGVDEEDLVIACWNEIAGEWVELEDITFEPSTHAVTASIYHLSAFAVIAHASPPSFSLSGLIINPTKAETGNGITVTVLATNTGDLSGDFEIAFKIDGVVKEARRLTLGGGETKEESFTCIAGASGVHEVDINGLTSIFTVSADTIPPTIPGENDATPESLDTEVDVSIVTDTPPVFSTIVYKPPAEPLMLGSGTLFQDSYKTGLIQPVWLVVFMYTLYFILFVFVVYFLKRQKASSTVAKRIDKSTPPPRYTIHF